jgi:hypothetical protein
MNDNAILNSVELLIDALRRHADMMARGEADPELAIPVIDAVRAAAARYVESVALVAEWGNLFEDLFDLEDDEMPALASEDEIDEPTIVTVRTRYDYTVPDVAALIQAGQAARERTWDAGESNIDAVGHIGEAIYEILHAGGAPIACLDVPQLQARSGLVTVHQAALPLSVADFAGDPDEDQLLAIDEADDLLYVLLEPRYSSRAEAERAAMYDTRSKPQPEG